MGDLDLILFLRVFLFFLLLLDLNLLSLDILFQRVGDSGWGGKPL